ncbi:hypothetical protein DESUT3_14520 [Desulfuromonas versatilis]|uniref:Membrane protein insertion efficiency factor YidD n=1 Tax=Desulfuromonas versatilis TaxID=2802975 RepID=A0ABN6DW64_9BACT|nr:membrane protein insertion efficiency factor YidD [Desulfuromonas versatilis]BCR04383.1 hypothetical protein DESUT3_14520 [Desulfuromonas versatilis]
MNRLVLLLILLALSRHPAGATDWGPWQEQSAPKSAGQYPGAADSPGLLRGGVRFFQKFISPVDGPRCPMYPTCSAYALQALDKHGPLVGTLLTVDRLLREGDPREHRHPVQTGAKTRFRDPLSNNDFWFAGPGESPPAAVSAGR